jgi:hypothetical protein
VNEHLRGCENANPVQIALAKAIGFSVPQGYTFVGLIIVEKAKSSGNTEASQLCNSWGHRHQAKVRTSRMIGSNLKGILLIGYEAKAGSGRDRHPSVTLGTLPCPETVLSPTGRIRAIQAGNPVLHIHDGGAEKNRTTRLTVAQEVY